MEKNVGFLKRILSPLNAGYRRRLISFQMSDPQIKTTPPDITKKPSGHSVRVETLKNALKSKDAAAIDEAARGLARTGSVKPQAWRTVCSLLSNGRRWGDIVRYLARTDGSWTESAEILLIAGRAERHLLNYEKSAELLSAAFDLAPTSFVNAELAHLFLDTGQNERLAHQLTFVLEDAKGYHIASALLRELARRSRDDATAVLLTATGNNETSEHFKMLLPDILAQVGAHAEACQALTPLIEIHPNDPQIGFRYMRSANAVYSDDYVTEAISVGERHLQSEHTPQPVAHRIASLLAQLYPRAPSSDATEEGLDAIEARFPTDEKILSILATGYFRNANLAKSERLLRRLIEMDPTEPEYAYRLAGILAQASRTSEAIESLAENFPESRRDARYHARIGHLKVWSGDWQEAIPSLTTALQIDPYLSTALADLSLCYDLQNDPILAFSLMKSAAVSAAMLPPKMTPGIDEIQPQRAKRRMWQLAHATGNTGFAEVLSKELRAENGPTMPFPLRQWTREPFTGLRVIAIADNGIGDEIRFTSAYHGHFHDAAEVTMTCDPRLFSLLRRSFPEYRFFPVQRVFPRLKKPRTDVRRRSVAKNMRALVTDEVVDAAEQAEIIVKCLDIFETTSFGHSDVAVSETIVADPELRTHYRGELLRQSQGRPVIGLSWRGGHHSYSRDPHYYTLEQWKPFLEMEEFCFVNMQYLLRDDELSLLRETLGDRFIEFPELDLMDDFEGMAALCAELDHIIGICTTILELAGAVGCPILYLMRCPQITHSIRLVGGADEFGSYADNVWTSCRIIPKFLRTDEETLSLGTRYLRHYHRTAAAAE